ncbi:MAG: DUF554 domain-containing protein [Verrucomicrobia bacterium]|nr:DUF554 domain-containing protein [Verrucomicrobiota bacterium]
MIGTILNAAAILVGGVAGLALAKEISSANQSRLKVALGVFVVYAGLSATWSGLNGSIGQIVKQIGIVLLSLILGNLLGKLLRIQKSLNSLGQYARDRFTKVRPTDPNRLSEGFVTCSLLFCVGPMAILGALQDGLSGDFKTLAIKSVMDGLATMAFAKTFGWGVILSLIPVVSYQGTLTLAARALQPMLRDQVLLDSINATGGLLVCCLALIILDLKKVRVADYLPSLAFAPLLTWVWH